MTTRERAYYIVLTSQSGYQQTHTIDPFCTSGQARAVASLVTGGPAEVRRSQPSLRAAALGWRNERS